MSSLPSDPPLPHRILSIQSHVISGYVGNKAAVFPLQLLGYDVDVLPSVTLSNHTGYKNKAHGPRHTADDIRTWLNGMNENQLLTGITHLLTGYIGTGDALGAVVDAVDLIKKQAGDHLIFVCDPVMGDNGKLYVASDVVDIYIERILPLASLITPNAFELRLLTSHQVNSVDDAFDACDTLHNKYGIPIVVVTGTRFNEDNDKVAVLVSARESQNLRFILEADFIPGSFTGTGDLLTALLMAWTSRMPDDLVSACRKAMASVTGVLRRTVKTASVPSMCSAPELQLVQSQDEILHPPEELITVKIVSER